MKNPLFGTLLVAILSCGVAAPAFAVETKKKPAAEKPAATKPADPAPVAALDAKTPAKPKLLPYQGEVDAVDTTAKTFVLKNKDGKAHTFAVSDQTQIMHGDASPAQFDEIKIGEWVRGSRVKTGEAKWDAVKVTIGKKETPEKLKAAGAVAPSGATTPAAKPAEKKTE
jgi:hypothetical protein